jgi:hypothetical protein
MAHEANCMLLRSIRIILCRILTHEANRVVSLQLASTGSGFSLRVHVVSHNSAQRAAYLVCLTYRMLYLGNLNHQSVPPATGMGQG